MPCATDAKNKSQRAAVLRRTVQYVRWVQTENRTLRSQLNLPEDDINFIPYDDDQSMNEHCMPGSRSPTVESCSNSDQGDDSGSSCGSHPIISSGTFHTFSITTNDAMIDVHTGWYGLFSYIILYHLSTNPPTPCSLPLSFHTNIPLLSIENIVAFFFQFINEQTIYNFS